MPCFVSDEHDLLAVRKPFRCAKHVVFHGSRGPEFLDHRRRSGNNTIWSLGGGTIEKRPLAVEGTSDCRAAPEPKHHWVQNRLSAAILLHHENPEFSPSAPNIRIRLPSGVLMSS